MIENPILDRRDLLSAVLVAVTVEVILIYQTGFPNPSQWGSRLVSMVLTAVAFTIVLALLKRFSGGDRATSRSE